MPSIEKYYIGFDLGGTKMRAVVVDRNYKILATVKQSTGPKPSVAEGMRKVKECIAKALRDANVPPKGLLGIGFGLPGILDVKTGTIVRLINVGWSNVPIAKLIEKDFGVPVAIDNDVNTGTYGECCLGAGKGQSHVVGIFPGTGIGGGIVIDGEIHHGIGGPVAEIGHIVYDPQGPLCNCGARGCYEVYAGRLAVAGRAARAAAMGQAPALMALAGADIRKIKSGVLAQSVAKGDKVVEAIVRESAHILGHLCCAMALTLAPGMIILGGGLVEAMEDIYLRECRKSVSGHPVVGMVNKVKVMPAKLGDDAVTLGAACLARKRVEGLAIK